MNELQEIEARLQERRAAWAASDPGEPSEIPPSLCFAHLTQAESDLDRAIAIAEDAISGQNNNSRVADAMAQERDQARADVLKLRNVVELASWNCSAAGDEEGVRYLDSFLAVSAPVEPSAASEPEDQSLPQLTIYDAIRESSGHVSDEYEEPPVPEGWRGEHFTGQD